MKTEIMQNATEIMNQTEEYRISTEPEVIEVESDDIYYRPKPYDTVKRILDFILSLIAIIVLSPLLLTVALVIFIDDPKGSPVYVSKRVGKGGKEFTFLKFRTMRVGADKMVDELMSQNEADGPAFKIQNDPRITRLGGFLRKTSLDELMQLFNILNGTMSIVGPRPPIPREVEQYTDRQRLRLAITPGLTCIWQIQPERNDISFDDWVEMDLKYIRERSFLLDVKLVLGTVKCVFGATGR